MSIDESQSVRPSASEIPARRTILLFTRSPEAEARAKKLPAAGARVFEAILLGWRQRAQETGADLLAVTPESCRGAIAKLLPGVCVSAQKGTTFADRLEAAFAYAFSQGAGAVLMVGGDCPPLSTLELNASFQHLESSSPGLVVTPADDGGVNAIGFSANAALPLQGIGWRGSSVCQELETAAESAGLAVFRTAAGQDLDAARDVRPLYRLSRAASLWRAFRGLLLSILQAPERGPARGRIVSSLLYFAPQITRGPPALELL